MNVSFFLLNISAAPIGDTLDISLPAKLSDFNIASKVIFEYIESWYNRKRIHSAINYMTPQDAHEAAA